jgi:hypothetical protein
MDEQLGRGLDYVSRQMCVSHTIMFYVCLTKKILIRGPVSPRDYTPSRLAILACWRSQARSTTDAVWSMSVSTFARPRDIDLLQHGAV